MKLTKELLLLLLFLFFDFVIDIDADKDHGERVDYSETSYKEHVLNLGKKWAAEKDSLRILVAGKTGVGKSTLVNALLGGKGAETKQSYDSVTKKPEGHRNKIGNIDVTVFDTPGLWNSKMKDDDIINGIKTATGGDIDLLFYCIKMTETQVRKGHIQAIQRVTEALGESVWEKGLFVLTFANHITEDNMPDNCEDRDLALADCFQNTLTNLKTDLHKIMVEDIGISPDVAGSIPVVPAGKLKKNKLPDREDWISELWIQAFRRLDFPAMMAFLLMSEGRITDSNDGIHKEEQPLFVNDMSEDDHLIDPGWYPMVGSLLSGTLGTVLGHFIIPGFGAASGEALGRAFGEYMKSTTLDNGQYEPPPTLTTAAEKVFLPSMMRALQEKIRVGPRDAVGTDLENFTLPDFSPPVRDEIVRALKLVKERKDSINQVSMNCVLFGPPRVGKSTLLKRLHGETSTPNISSTGVAGAAVQVHINNTRISDATVQVSDLKWNKMDLKHEAAHLIQSILKSAKTATTEQTVTSTATVSSEAPATSNGGNTPDKAATGSTHQTSPDEADTHQNSTDEAATSNAGNIHQDNPDEADIPKEFTDILREVMEKGDWSGVEQALGGEPWTLHLTDTGGQPEFQQLLPALVFGPTIFFLVFRLDLDLDEFHRVEYMDSTGRSIVPYTSSYTPIDTILQSLSSVASITRMEENNVGQTKPRVFLIGTFKDKVSEKEITTIDARLHKVIEEHDKDKIVQYANSSQSRPIFTIDNFSPDETDIMRIREAVKNLGTHDLTKEDYKITTPYPWLIFGIFIRRLESSILSYERCFTIAQQLGINTREELNSVLHFLHMRVGVIQYFPTEDLQDIVIKDPQYIFDRITSLIVKTFTFEEMPNIHHIPSDFMKKGIFDLDDFVKVANTSSELLTPTKFLSLLKHLHIVVPLESSSNNHTKKYFMPCALSHVEAAQPSQQPSIGEPLLISFDSGYTPQGLFGQLISYLLGKNKSELQWKLVEDKIFRDQVTLKLTRQYNVVLRIHPAYLSATLIQTNSCHWLFRYWTNVYNNSCNDNIAKICNDIRQSLEDGLRNVSKCLQTHNPHKLSFICPKVERDDRCHAVIVQDPNGQYLKSIQDPPITWDLSHYHCVWLPQGEGSCGTNSIILMISGLDIGFVTVTVVIGVFGIFIFVVCQVSWRSQGKTPTNDHHTAPQPNDQLGADNKPEITEYLEKIGNNQDLLRLGEGLGLNGRKLRKRKDSDTFLDDLVGDWLERKDRVDEVGKPTWRKLVEVLRKVGQNGLANDIEKEKLHISHH